MKLREQYDWLVLGDHPGALLSASLAARLGLSVLVLPFGPVARLFVSASGQHFDPESNYLIGLAPTSTQSGVSAGLLGACLKRLGVLASEEEFIQVEGFPHVVTPSARVLVQPDAARLGTELKRELGKDAVDRLGLIQAMKLGRPELERYWLERPARLSVAPDSAGKPGARKPTRAQSEKLGHVYRRLGAQVRSTQKSAQAWFVGENRVSDLLRLHPELDLEDVCRGLWHGVSSTGIHDPELPNVLQALALAGSAASFRGGMTAYREFMLRLARRAGADIPPKTECRRIFIEGGRLIGVQVSNHGNMIGTPAGVLGCSLEYASSKVTSTGSGFFKRLRAPTRPSGWRFSIALTVQQDAIPALTPSRVVWQEKDAPAILIEIVDPADYGHKEPDHRIVFARTIVPFTGETLVGSYQRMIAARLFRQLTEIFPFLEFHVRRIFPDFRSSVSQGFLQAPAELKSQGRSERDEFAEAFPFATLADVPESLRCYAGSKVGSRSGVEGLFVASGESFPELGTLGPTVAAVEAVAWLAHRSGLSGPFN